MTELHAGLELFRDQLRDAIARDVDRRPRRRAVRGAIPVAGIAAAGAAVLAITGGTPAPTADAVVMRHVVAALTAPPATILHERAFVIAGSKSTRFELWAQSNPPYAYRVIKWGGEGTGTGNAAPDDPAATLRSMVQSGQAHIDATTTFDGVSAYKLSVSGSSERFINGTAYVSRADYHPLEIDTPDGGGERIVFQTYEYLPVTAANLALLR
jgi:hypothetical protein